MANGKNDDENGTRPCEIATCPTCGKQAVRGGAPDPRPGVVDPFPFCSFRCQLVDLGRWLGEDYRVAED